MIGVLRLGWSAVYVHEASDGLALVDAGPDYDGAWESLCGLLRDLGAAPRDVRDVLITHAHIDHAGLAWRWREAGARLWIGAADRAALASGAGGVAGVRATAVAFLRAQGVPADLSPGPFRRREGAMTRDGEPARTGAIAASRRETTRRADDPGLRGGHYDHAAHWPGRLHWRPAGADGLLADGAKIGGLRVIACPGHTPGSMALHDERAGLLYTGDHLLPGITPPPGLNFDGETRAPSLPSWLASLERLREFDGAQVLPGHGESFGALGAALDRNLAHAAQQARRLRRLLQREPATPYALVQELYPHLPSGLLWFKLAEVIGQLDLLQDHGDVRRVGEDEARDGVLS